jgi:hypothetical protein
MNRCPLLLVATLFCLLAGCSRSSPRAEVPSWFKSNAGLPGQKATPEQVRAQIKAAELQIERLEKSRKANGAILEKCLKEKQDIVARLKSAGVKSGEDLKGNPKARKYADDLLKLSNELEGYERVDAAFEDGIAQCKALVRRLEQSLVLDEAGITDQELAEVSAAILRLNEKQGVAPAGLPTDLLKLEKLLQKELGGR